MAKENTGKKQVVITNTPVQTHQTILNKPNGNTVIVEKNKSVVPTTTVKEKILYDEAGVPTGEALVTRTVKERTTPITRTVINKQGEIVKQKVDIKTSKNVVKKKVITPYSSPDYGTETPVTNVNTGTATQYDQVITYPAIDPNTGQVVPPLDTSGEDYIDVGSVASTANGAIIAQTFRSPKDGFVAKIKARLYDIGPSGDLTCHLCATMRTGEPDLAQVIATTTVAYADLVAGWQPFALTPAYVQKGTLYAAVFVSAGAHTFEIAVGGNYSQGTFFTSQDAAWFKGALDEDLGIQVLYAEFINLQTITTMEPLALEGGIGALMTKLYEIEPEGTQRVLQGQINGVWTDLAADTEAYPLTNLPAQVLLRQILTGTKDLMPATNHDVSKVITYRLKADFDGVTHLISTGTNVTSASVTLTMVNFKEADHDCVVKLLKADNTPITHSAVSDTPTDDPLIIERKFTFTFSALNQFRIKVEGDTVSSLSTFGVSEVLYSAA